MTQSSRCVWVLSDGRPGHFQQSKGLVMALQRRESLDEVWLSIGLRAGWSRRLLRFLLNRNLKPMPMWLLGLFYRLPTLPRVKPELIVSAGGDTAMVNIALARHFGARNAFMGSARHLKGRNFTALLTIDPQSDPENNIVLPLAPVPVDRMKLGMAGRALRHSFAVSAEQPLLVVLAGGDGAGFVWSAQDWRQLGLAVSELAQRMGYRLLVTTSRRTGGEGEAALASTILPVLLVDAVWYGREPRQVMTAYLGAANAVICTSDSMSMVSEVVAAGKPLCVVAPARATPDESFRLALDRLAMAGRLKLLPVDGLAEADGVFDALTPLQDDLLDLVAHEVADILLPRSTD
jgi:mitochondrial fission protein ELM1